MKKYQKFFERGCEWNIGFWALPFEFIGRNFQMWIQTERYDGGGKVDWVRVWDYNRHLLFDVRTKGDGEVRWKRWLGPRTTRPWPYDGTAAEEFLMTEDDRRDMLRTMRLIISFRQSPLPQEARDLWQGALDLVNIAVTA